VAAENLNPSADTAQHMVYAVAIPETPRSVHISAAAGQCVHVAAATGHSPGSDSSCSRVIVNNVGPLNGVIEHVAAATACPKQPFAVHAPIVQELSPCHATVEAEDSPSYSYSPHTQRVEIISTGESSDVSGHVVVQVCTLHTPPAVQISSHRMTEAT
jgi:hypothetical protein